MPRPLGTTDILRLGTVREPGTGSGGGTTLYPVFTTSGTGPFTIGMQVTDLATATSVSGRYWVRVNIGTTNYANDAVGSITYNTETMHLEATDGHTDIMTSSTGYCEIEVAATANRYVVAAVGMEKVYSTGLLTYGVVSHPVSLITRLTPLGLPGRRCGSFAGR